MGEGAGCGGGERAGDRAKGRAAVLGGVLGEGGSQGPGREDLEEARHRGRGALPPQGESRRVGWKSRQVFTLACLSDVSYQTRGYLLGQGGAAIYYLYTYDMAGMYHWLYIYLLSFYH